MSIYINCFCGTKLTGKHEDKNIICPKCKLNYSFWFNPQENRYVIERKENK